MRKFCVLVAGIAVFAVAQTTLAAARGEGERLPPQDDSSSLASPNYRGYRPAWANPYAEPDMLGVNDDPTPFYPSDVDSGPSPLDPDEY